MCEHNIGIHIVGILANVIEVKKIYFTLILVVTLTSVVVCEIVNQVINLTIQPLLLHASPLSRYYSS